MTVTTPTLPGSARSTLPGASVRDCGCPDGERPSAMSRRTLLKALGGAAITLTATDAVHTQVAMAAPGYTGDVLVVLSLRGGFDGLSAVVPGGDPDYYRLRPRIGVPQSVLLPIDTTFGLHPALAPLMPLWKSGALGAVHGVGQPNPTRSHFAAMEEMERAAPGTSLRTGWLDRTTGLVGTGGTFSATHVGSSTTPTSMLGPRAEFATSSLAGFELKGPWDDRERTRWTNALTELHREGPPTVAAAGTSALAAAAAISSMGGQEPAATYPEGALGTSLRDLARLIKSGGVQVASVDFGDWDMHADLGGHSGGWMKNKLTELASAMVAFHTDLGALMGGVTVVTLSEFGRRAAENGSGGLDHGHGNAMLVMGGGVVGGKVHGSWKGLSSSALDDGALAGSTDYRTVIGELLQKRCGAGSLSDVFPGFSSGSTLGVFRAR